MAIRQCFSWDGFARTGIEPARLISGAAQIGYAGIEMVPPEFWPQVRDAGLRLVSLAGHRLSGPGLNDRGKFGVVETAVRDSLEKAVEWKIPYVICFSGNRGVVSPAEAPRIVAEGLSKLAPHFAGTGVTLVLELLNSKVTHRDYEADRTPWGVEVCRQVNAPQVRLLYDVFHMQIMEGDLIRTIRENNAWFAHYHTAGNPGRNDLDDEQEINYPPVVRAIAATGHDGFLGHEFMPKGEAIAALRAAYELCQPALAKA